MLWITAVAPATARWTAETWRGLSMAWVHLVIVVVKVFPRGVWVGRGVVAPPVGRLEWWASARLTDWRGEVVVFRRTLAGKQETPGRIHGAVPFVGAAVFEVCAAAGGGRGSGLEGSLVVVALAVIVVLAVVEDGGCAGDAAGVRVAGLDRVGAEAVKITRKIWRARKLQDYATNVTGGDVCETKTIDKKEEDGMEAKCPTKLWSTTLYGFPV